MNLLCSYEYMFHTYKYSILSDVRGDLKLFDFGLAKLMPTEIDPYEDLHKMSMAGTPRYMSPEALGGKAYNLKADVYTFSVVLWQILSLHRPFVGIRNNPALIRHVGK
jgi:serine/threonine protein kinase